LSVRVARLGTVTSGTGSALQRVAFALANPYAAGCGIGHPQSYPWKGIEMMDRVLLAVSSGVLAFWGVAHLFVTASICRSFGEITEDNRRILVMEWIAEGLCLLLLAAVICAATTVDPNAAVSRVIYIISVVALNILSVVSLLTGFRVPYLPFKLCPFIFTGASVLILVGGIL
jgi:hypothetical protein